MSQQAYVPRRLPMAGKDGIVSREWDVWFQTLAQTLNELRALLQSGATVPNGHVIGSPGDIYSSTLGGSNLTLWVKEAGTQTDTGWAAK